MSCVAVTLPFHIPKLGLDTSSSNAKEPKHGASQLKQGSVFYGWEPSKIWNSRMWGASVAIRMRKRTLAAALFGKMPIFL